MVCKTALLLALLIAASQAAPQGQVQNTAPQQTDSSTAATGANSDTSSSASGNSGSSSGGSSSGAQASSGSSANTGNSTGAQPPTVVFPHFSNLLPSFNFTGSPSSANAQNPIAAVISFIPNAINAERERVSNAVQGLVSKQVEAATDSIGAAAQTGGQLFSNGIKAIASWPTFWANLLG